jgi:6-phosphofructokinase
MNVKASFVQEWSINMFFIIGGNGSHAGATAIYKFVSLLISYMV